MAANSVESAIKYLTETVLELNNQVSSLEKTIQDQNNVIKKLIRVSEVSDKSVINKNIEKNEEMTIFHDEIEIEDFEYDEEDEMYYYPCPCGDRFQISKEELLAGEEVATCPSCSLVVKVIYDLDNFKAEAEEIHTAAMDKETVKTKV